MEAKFFDGRTALRYSVQVDILSDRVVFRRADNNSNYDWFFRDVEVEKISETVLILRNRLIPDARLEVEGSAAVHALQGRLRFRPSVIWTEDTKVLTAIICAFLFVMASVFWFLDDLTEELVTHMPISVEKQLFGDYESSLHLIKCQSPEAQAAIDQLVKRLMTAEEYKDFRVVVVESAVVNAFALPGGSIIIHSALIKEIHHSDELAGVLAHEIEHQSQRHIAKSLIKRSAVSVLGSFIIGGKAGDLAGFLTGLKFSRDLEATADRGAAVRLDRAGISRMGLVHFLKRLSKMTKIPEIVSTHPIEGREDQLTDNYDSSKKFSPSLTDGEFRSLKSLKCGVQ